MCIGNKYIGFSYTYTCICNYTHTENNIVTCMLM